MIVTITVVVSLVVFAILLIRNIIVSVTHLVGLRTHSLNFLTCRGPHSGSRLKFRDYPEH